MAQHWMSGFADMALRVVVDRAWLGLMGGGGDNIVASNVEVDVAIIDMAQASLLLSSVCIFKGLLTPNFFSLSLRS